ncbi:MAG: glycoside hydrolase family 97 catalytic domain-containing protein [Bacteroidales bacterium]|nr:glycoside hydrolase family 97 catalytic domain-containing protein [Candidatus Liminaster caballi]
MNKFFSDSSHRLYSLCFVTSAVLAAIAGVSCTQQQQPAAGTLAQSVTSPDGHLQLNIYSGSQTSYSVALDGKIVIEQSPLGLVANYADLAKDLTLVSSAVDTVARSYDMNRAKASHIDYRATRLTCQFQNPDAWPIAMSFEVSNNNIAFRYELSKHPDQGIETGSVRVMEEKTGYRFADGTTTFLTPQSDPMIGWKRTKPSYEEDYVYDAPMTQRSAYGKGWTFPCLFHQHEADGKDYWIMVSETGVDSHYCGSRLSDWHDGLYTIAFPMPEEQNGNGTVEPAFALPGATPWRTLTIADNLAPIAETTVMYDVVEPRYETKNDYKFGRGTWSWILWQDESINYDDLVKYIDLASAMGYEYALVDNWWDTNIGRERIADLVRYAQSKNVDIFLWYSSSGYWNDIVQGPINCMDNSIVRKREMRWMKELGVKGIKVDFFAGDKQETMRLYEEILSDADDNGLMVIFHGCTLPRGWERMYPNYVGSEAVLASENLIFNQKYCDIEAMNVCTHPFIRNTVGCMEFGGCFMNKYMHRANGTEISKSKGTPRGNRRMTTDVLELATTILFQNPIQNFALAPNNLAELNVEEGRDAGPAPKVCMDFLKLVPTTWDETHLIAGYPGKSVAMVRRSGDNWFFAAANAGDEAFSFVIDLNNYPSLDAEKLVLICGGNDPVVARPRVEDGKIYLTIEKNDGVVLTTLSMASSPRFRMHRNPEQRHSLSVGHMTMEIDAANGGRVMSLKYDTTEVISQSKVPNHYGSTFWTSPQAEWVWPPVFEHDMAPFTVENDGNALVMTGPLSVQYPVRISKRFETDEADQCFVVTYSIKNESARVRKVAPWEITRVPSVGTILFDAEVEKITPAGLMPFFKNADGLAQYDIDHTGVNRKINADGKGWLSYINNGMRLTKRFDDLTPEQPAPAEAEIQIYVDGGNKIVEIESQGAYTELAPGESLSWSVRWYLTPEK